jgi:DNA-directed RNA polymerase subunit RPC12/RpoP
MGFKCEFCGKKINKVYENERNEFWRCEKHHIVKEVKDGKEQVRNVDAVVFMVAKPKKP